MESLNHTLTTRLASLPQGSRFYLRVDGVIFRLGPLPSDVHSSDLRFPLPFTNRAEEEYTSFPRPSVSTDKVEIVTSFLEWDETHQLLEWQRLDKELASSIPPVYQRCEHGLLSRAFLQEVVMLDRKQLFRLSRICAKVPPFKEEHILAEPTGKLQELLQAEHDDWVSFGDYSGVRRSFLKHIYCVYSEGVYLHLPGQEMYLAMSAPFLRALEDLLTPPPPPPVIEAWAIYYPGGLQDTMPTTVIACCTDGTHMSVPCSTAERVIPDPHTIWSEGYHFAFRKSFLDKVYLVDVASTLVTLHSSCGKVQIPIGVCDGFVDAVEKFIRPPMVRGVALDKLVCAWYDHQRLTVVGKHLDGQLFTVACSPTRLFAKTQLQKLDTEVTSQFFQVMSIPDKLIVFRKNFLEESTWALEPLGDGFKLKMGDLHLLLLPKEVAPLVTQLPIGKATASVLDFFEKQ